MSVGPFEAEARGREKEEDILTSRFFGILNRVDKVTVLGGTLKKLGVDIPDAELKQAEIRLCFVAWGLVGFLNVKKCFKFGEKEEKLIEIN